MCISCSPPIDSSYLTLLRQRSGLLTDSGTMNINVHKVAVHYYQVLLSIIQNKFLFC